MTPSRSEIKLIKSLAKKKHRDEHGLFIIEGEKLMEEAIYSGIEIVKIFRRDETGIEGMKKITHLSTPSPVLAIAKKPLVCEEEEPADGGFYLGLDSIRDPGNMGTIVRLSEWFGVSAVYCSHDCVDIFNPKVIQSSMGSLFRSKIFYLDMKDLIERNRGKIKVYGTFLDGKSIYTEQKRSGLVIMGNESNGISEELSSLVDHKITIPSFSVDKQTDSLNVAVATAIVCSEFKGHPFASLPQNR